MTLTRSQATALADALVSAIPTYEELRQIVQYGLDQSLDAMAPDGDLQQMTSNLVASVQTQPNAVARLVTAAREARPDDPGLIAIAQGLGLAPEVPAARDQEEALERAVDPLSMLVDLPTWLSRGGRLEAQVCLIELRGKPHGTGFLVGPDAVMTNYHVVETVLNGGATPADLTVLFDYKRAADGTVINPGVRYALASPAWLIDASPYHPAERAGESDAIPAPDQLDYALLHTAKTPGTDPVGGTLGPPRGWIVPRAEEYPFAAGDILYVIQHPRGAPLKIATGTVNGMNANRSRVTYQPTTDKGSSGSPVFNRDWELVALHHSGVKTHNQGIPIAAIRRQLTKRGFAAALGAEPPAMSPPIAAPGNDMQRPREGAVIAESAGRPADGRPAEDPLAEPSLQSLEELDEALRSAFNRGRMERLLRYRFGTSLGDIAPGRSTYPEEIQALIDWAVGGGRIRRLVEQAILMNDGNPKLNAWARRYL